jgi:hypothetical protein
MSNAMTPTPSLADFRNRATAALEPFFAEAPGGQMEGARSLAESMLDEYNAQTPRELQLAAQIIALGWTSLACLSAAMTVRDKSLDEMLDLQDVAIKLSRAKEKATKALDARREERAKKPRAMTPENTRWDEGAFQLSINQTLDAFLGASAKVKAFMATVTPAQKKKPKLPIGFAEQMTPSVLARRARQ